MHITSFGFEIEFFVVDAIGRPTLAFPDFPYDHCGYLAEARSEPHANPLTAAFLAMAATEELARLVKSKNLSLAKLDTMDIPKEQLRVWARKFGKNPARSYFMNGGCYRNNNPRAGLHVHFSKTRKVETKNGFETVPDQLNIPRIVFMMDRVFKEHIRKAKRIPGEYELKPYGFEYRSLPATTNLMDVVAVLEEIQRD